MDAAEGETMNTTTREAFERVRSDIAYDEYHRVKPATVICATEDLRALLWALAEQDAVLQGVLKDGKPSA